jgi:hypothetical protein
LIFETNPKYNLRQFPFNLFPYADAVEEYYVIELYSEKGSIGNFSYSITQYTPWALSNDKDFQRNLFSHNVSNTYSQGTAGYSNGTSMGYINGPTKNLDTSFGKPGTLTLTVRREGWAIFKNNSTTIHLADSKIIEKVTLERYSDGFIYNKLFTPEVLSKINPVMPQFEVYK